MKSWNLIKEQLEYDRRAIARCNASERWKVDKINKIDEAISEIDEFIEIAREALVLAAKQSNL